MTRWPAIKPKYRDAIAYIPGEGERRGRRRRKYNKVAKSGEREGRWKGGGPQDPLLQSRYFTKRRSKEWGLWMV